MSVMTQSKRIVHHLTHYTKWSIEERTRHEQDRGKRVDKSIKNGLVEGLGRALGLNFEN